MNKFTADFHSGKFPGFTLNKTYQEIIDNFWFSKDIPFIETDFNIDVTRTYNWLSEHDYLFEEQYTQINRLNFAKSHGYDWFTDPHSNGWGVLDILGDDIDVSQLVSGGVHQNQSRRQTQRRTLDVLQDLQRQLNDQNLPINRLMIFRLAPMGWLQPHMDRKVSGTPIMNNIWLPLHDFDPSLKIYPYGYVHHVTGRAYILNNSEFVHSVINLNSAPRYVALIKLDYQNVSKNTQNRFYHSLKTQWFS